MDIIRILTVALVMMEIIKIVVKAEILVASGALEVRLALADITVVLKVVLENLIWAMTQQVFI